MKTLSEMQNIGELERFVRLILSVGMLALLTAGWFDPMLALVLLPVALTAMAGICPVYTVLGVSTCQPHAH
jgi:hypothetical protein